MKKEIVLKGKGFILRPYRKGDEISLRENADDKAIARNMQNGFPSPYTRKDAKAWVLKRLRQYRKQKFPLVFAIDVGGRAVGDIAGGAGGKQNGTIHLGYWIGKKYRGKGIMTNSVRLYTRYLFRVSNFHKITTQVFPWNKASRHVLEKNGFRLEGIIRKEYLKDGKLIDEYYYGKLRNER